MRTPQISLRNSALCAVSAVAIASLHMSAANAQTAEANGDNELSSDRVTNPEEIVVSGRTSIGSGLMKQQTAPEAISSITSAAIAQKMPAASPLQISSTIPGANFGSSDSFGLSVRNFLSVRGLEQTELGFLVEGIPGIDPTSYFPFTETYADSENVADITLTAGNSRLQDPIINASGGEFIMTIRKPGEDLGGLVSGSIGSNKGRRGFARLDTGEIGKTGITAFASYSRTEADNYIGPGRNKRDHIDFKAYKDWGDGSHSSLFVNYTNWLNARIPPFTLAQYNTAKASGNFDQFTYAPTFVPGVTTNYWEANLYRRKSVFSSLINEIQIKDNLKINFTPYFRYTGYISSGAINLNPNSVYAGVNKVTPAYNPSVLQNGRLFAITNQVGDQYQFGANAFIEWNPSDSNHLIAGYWHDDWRVRVNTGINLQDTQGNIAGFGPDYGLRSTTGELITGTNYKIRTYVNQLFIGDTQSFFDNRLKISVGLKYLFYKVSAENFANGPQGAFNVSIGKPMPRASFSFEINDQMQLYGNITANARMPLTGASYMNVYSVSTGAITTRGNPSISAETSLGEQLGFRYYGSFNFDLNVFHMRLKDHQVSSLNLINGVLQPQVISVGDETFWGISGEVSTHRYAGFSFYANAQYLKTRQEDNFPVGADFLPTKGKDMVESPEWIANAGLNYDNGPFYANVAFKWVDSQYSTFMNNQKMPSYTTLDMGFGVRLPEVGGLKEPKIALNLNNLTQGKYIASVASVTGTAVATQGVNGTTINGSAPGYYISAPFAALLTLSTGF